MADVGALLTEQGVPVISTPPRIVPCPPAWPAIQKVSIDSEGKPDAKVPGLQTTYEPPETPDLVLQCEDESPEAAAERVVALLVEKGYIR